MEYSKEFGDFLKTLHESLKGTSTKAKYIASGQVGLDVASNPGGVSEIPTQSVIESREGKYGTEYYLVDKKPERGI